VELCAGGGAAGGSSAKRRGSERGLARAVGSIALVGAGLGAYLTYVRYTGGTVACTTGGCELVQGSRYSAVAGIPVALIGLVGYVAIALSTLVRGEAGAAIGLALTVVGFAFAMYLLYLQAFVIEAYCHWCLASDGVMTVLLVLGALRLAAAVREGPEASGVETASA
jgi:uncharacterized membrane protein